MFLQMRHDICAQNISVIISLATCRYLADKVGGLKQNS